MLEYTKIRLPKTELGSRAFAALAKQHRVRGIREQAEVVYEVPYSALELLVSLGLPYETLPGYPSLAESPDAR